MFVYPIHEVIEEWQCGLALSSSKDTVCFRLLCHEFAEEPEIVGCIDCFVSSMTPLFLSSAGGKD